MNNRPPAASGDGTGDSDWVIVGQVSGVFGVHGEIKIEPYTSFPDRFAENHIVYAGAKRTPYTILAAHPHKRHILLRLEGITDRDAAERLHGMEVCIPARDIHELPDDHFYLHDVIGLEVQTTDGRKLGAVKDILVTGGTDLFVIERDESGREMLLPAIKEFIKLIDIGAGVMKVDLIPGLLDDDSATEG